VYNRLSSVNKGKLSLVPKEDGTASAELSGQSTSTAPASDWQQQAVEDASKRQGDLLIAIAPGVKKFVEAVR
jgi:hypothetical protein